MVREILQISVGQCGNQIGKIFWRGILEEHNVDFNGCYQGDNLRQIEKLGVYMAEVDTSETKKETMSETIERNLSAMSSTNPNPSAVVGEHIRFVPRSVLLDLEPGVIDGIKASPIGNLFAPDTMVHAVSGAGNNWAKGHYVVGAEIIDDAMDCVRKYVEDCDCLQGFQLTQALGGGTGSGFGTLVLNKLRDAYPDRINCTYSVYPAPKVSDIVVEPYNALLSIAQLMESSDETFVIDNQSLIQISDKILKQDSPSFNDLNWVISLIMSGVTASLRFSGLLNGDLRKMATNLIPFPRLHFFSCSFAPLFERGKAGYTNWSFRNITEDIWRDDHFLADINQMDGKYLSCCINYRGKQDTSSYVIDSTIREMQLKNNDQFVSWIPHNVKTSIITIPPPQVDKCASLISNTTAIKSVFMRISASFASLFKRKAFLHWYLDEGMDEMEFIDADASIRDLICEYQEKQDAIYMEPSAPSTDDEEFEDRLVGKSEEHKAQAYIQRKLRKLERQMEKEDKEREVAQKNKDKSVFGNIKNVKKQVPKRRYKARPRPNPGGQKKERAAIIWSDDDADDLDEEQEEEQEQEQEQEQEPYEDEEQYDENADYDENAPYEENTRYDENGQYDDNEAYDENAPYDENAHYEENATYDEDAAYDENAEYDENAPEEENAQYDENAPYDENYEEEYDENYDANYDPNYDATRVEEETKKKKKKKKRKEIKKKKPKEEEDGDILEFLNSD